MKLGEKTSQELMDLANDYNWDDGFELPNKIADHPNCDLGTALSLLWLSEAIIYYTGEVKESPYNKDWVYFCRKLIKRLSNSYYKIGETSFDPELTKAQIYKMKKANIPEFFYQTVKEKNANHASAPDARHRAD
ncbi:hypothetical protein JY97_12245 [Alkalispirochaeta odontotermitis]|nr:hypothetical protein JY97_12245 [Alkalispirochaeta odontotermitis]CAB1076020.1 hypothetical protein D1AOALGA4SA_3822 [Olavius algarvensis Delta 1 endosymbiont]